jgi:amino acid transporter
MPRDAAPPASACASTPAAPRATLGTLDGIAFMVGIVVGIGIFRTPQVVAANAASGAEFLGLWLLGGLLTLVGALCYAELGAAHPHAGGEYHFLSRAYGAPVATLFAWARGAVIQTGAIATVAFVYGDYAAGLLPLGAHGPALHAALAIVAVTGVNVQGISLGSRLQRLFTLSTLLALGAVVVAGFQAGAATDGAVGAAPAAEAVPPGGGAAGLALVFVLLTYGGWNEAAYLSGELREVRRRMARILVGGTLVVVVAYGLVNLAYLEGLGLAGLRASETVAADVLRRAAGEPGAALMSLFIGCAALSTLNATVFTGARVYWALGRDVPALQRFGAWSARGDTPANALWLQCAIALALVAYGAMTPDGFQAMVEYTAPVFWLFLLLVALSVFVFRWREPAADLPFRVPLYPLTPALFVATCLYLLYSSLAYTGPGALLGVAVLALGLPLLVLRGRA